MSVLDFGAGGGELVYALRAMGLKAAGFEPNEGYARFASDMLGLPVSHAFYQNARVEAGSHELVTMFHVLEHLEHPCEALRHVREWLRPQGLLFVEVPNIEAICQWPGSVFHRAHLYNFSPAALKMAGQRAGYAIVSSDISADGGNISVVLQKADSPIAGSGQIPGNYERVRSILRRHTAFRHLLSPFPYIRPLRKLAANLEERRAVKKDLSPNAILDRVTSLHATWQSASASKAGHCGPAL
jgi:SAM-dependent methyltransferase